MKFSASNIQTFAHRRRMALWLAPIAFGLMSATLALPALAQEQLMRTLTVTGQGEEMIPATLAQVSLGVEAQGETAEAVQQQVAQRAEAVVRLLRSRNVQKLETTGINLSPVYNYNDGEQRLVGYTASNIVRFQVEAERAGDILDDAVQAGATRIDSLSFIATNDAIATARQQALREATQDAQQQADAVLSSLGLTRQEIVGIQVEGANAAPPPPMPYQRAELAADSAAKTPVVGGEQEVRAAVTLQIRY